MILTGKKLDIWAPPKLHHMICNTPSSEEGNWFDDLLVIVKPCNEQLQVHMNNEWTALFYLYKQDLEERAKKDKITPHQWVHNYCESVKKSHKVVYVD